MLSFRGVSACISVDGVDLPCFQPEYSEDMRTATCWIPSEAGKEYAVSWTQVDVKTKTAGRILLDGSQRPAASASLCDGKSCSRSAATLSAAEERPPVFSSIQATDDDSLLNQPLNWNAPGTIRLEVLRIRIIGRPVPSISLEENVAFPHEPVHERSKKAVVHVTKLGPKRRPRERKAWNAEPYTPGDRLPWVTFVFRYRPADVLQAEELMPRPIAPVAPTVAVKVEPEVKVEAEVDEAFHTAEILAIEEEQRRIKAQQEALDARIAALSSGRLIKKEEETPQPRPRPRPAARSQPSVYIDLTLSD